MLLPLCSSPALARTKVLQRFSHRIVDGPEGSLVFGIQHKQVLALRHCRIITAYVTAGGIAGIDAGNAGSTNIRGVRRGVCGGVWMIVCNTMDALLHDFLSRLFLLANPLKLQHHFIPSIPNTTLILLLPLPLPLPSLARAAAVCVIRIIRAVHSEGLDQKEVVVEVGGGPQALQATQAKVLRIKAFLPLAH